MPTHKELFLQYSQDYFPDLIPKLEERSLRAYKDENGNWTVFMDETNLTGREISIIREYYLKAVQASTQD